MNRKNILPLIFLPFLFIIFSCRVKALDLTPFQNSNNTTYLNNNIKLTIPNSVINEELILNIRKLTFTGNLKNKFHSNSDYFEIYFENNNFVKTNINSVPMLLKINLDYTKDFQGIYEIQANNIILLDYEINEHELKAIIKNTGKYLISYNNNYENKLVSSIIQDKRLDTNRKNNAFWMLATIILLIIAIALTIEIKHKKAIF